MLGVSVCGAAIAGLYGIVHDQITFTISPEYFTHLKFDQFSFADFGLAPRLFVVIIGFLATWWVGFFAGWFLARIVLVKMPISLATPVLVKAFTWIIACALVAGFIGNLLAAAGLYHHENWQSAAQALAIKDLPAFVRVAFIHNGSYLGGLIGLIIAIGYCRRFIKHGQTNLLTKKSAQIRRI